MADDNLTYSQRKKLNEEGSLGVVIHEEIPPTLSSAVAYKLNKQFKVVVAGSKFKSNLFEDCMTHFGFYDFSDHTSTQEFLNKLGVDRFLDLCELAIKRGGELVSYNGKFYYGWKTAEDDLNEYFERHRFGYRIETGKAFRIDSPLLDTIITSPALFAGKSDGWEEVEKSYSKALEHFKGTEEEIADSITAAYSALESALKASGYKGAKLKTLAADFRKKELANTNLSDVPSLLEKLMQKVPSVRHSEGNSHGKQPDAPKAKRESASLIIHWVGSLIVFLHSRTNSTTASDSGK